MGEEKIKGGNTLSSEQYLSKCSPWPLANYCNNFSHSCIHPEQWSLVTGGAGPSVEPTDYITPHHVAMETATVTGL